MIFKFICSDGIYHNEMKTMVYIHGCKHGASGEKMGDIDKIIIKKIVQNIITWHEIDESSKKITMTSSL